MSTPGPDIQAGNSIPLTSQNLNSPPTRHDSSASLESLEPSKSLPPTWFTRWFVDWWLLEILSWCFGVVCMIIITVVLSLYNGSELPKWHLSISLNAILTIFSGLAKSALLVPVAEALGQLKWDWFRKGKQRMTDLERLDSASRGTWGALALIVQTRKVTLPTIGAAIILLSLPLDGFFQQIVKYPSIYVLDRNSKATISRGIYYSPDHMEYWSDGSWGEGPVMEIDSYVSMFWTNGGLTPPVEFSCPTGNCTYDPFSTLALDFQCKKLDTNMLEFGCQNTSAEWMATVHYSGPRSSPNVTSCGFYLNVPNNPPQLMSGYEIKADGSVGEVLHTRFFALSDVYTNEQFYNGSIAFKDVKNPVVDFVLASNPSGFDGARKNATPVLTECEIHWVVKLLKATVVSGHLHEEALDTWEFRSDLANPWDPDDSDVYLANFSMTLLDPQSPTGETSTFGLNNVTARKTWQVWTAIAPSTFTLPAQDNPVASVPVWKYKWLAETPHVQKFNLRSLPWSADQNITQHMADMVTTMNQIVRRNPSGERHDIAVGDAWRYVQVVRVRWPWMAMPISLLLISGAFLFVTIFRSTKNEGSVGIWKSSALAPLFNQLDDDVQGCIGIEYKKKRGDMKARATVMQVQLLV